METSNNKSIAAVIHLSTLAQYFIPFTNFILPIVIWSSAKNNSKFVDKHGRESINFQLSIFLYSLILALIAIPTLIFTVFKNIPFRAVINDENVFINHFSAGNITGIVLVAVIAILVIVILKVAEFFLVIYAAVKAANGEMYEYPLSISFIKPSPVVPIKTTVETTMEA